jgi:hypothetical protein
MPSLPGEPRRDRARRSGRWGQSRCSRRMGIGRWRGAFQIDHRWWRGRRSPARRRRRLDTAGRVSQELLPRETGVTGTPLRVQDLEVRVPARRSVVIARDRHRAALPHHVPAQPDPFGPLQLQAHTARLLDGGHQPPPERVRLHDHQQRPRAPRERREPAKPIADAHAADRRVPAIGQIDDEQVHGPGGEQRRREAQGLLEVDGREHHEPLRADPTGDGLHGIEGPGEIEPGDDRARRLCLGREPEGEGGLARGGIPAQGDRGGARQPAHAQDGVERSETRRHDAAIRDRRRLGRTRRCDRRQRDQPGRRPCGGAVCVVRVIERHRRASERALDHETQVAAPPRSCGTPARLERREGLGDVGCGSHRTSNIRTDVLVRQERTAATSGRRGAGSAGSRATLPGRSTRPAG